MSQDEQPITLADSIRRKIAEQENPGSAPPSTSKSKTKTLQAEFSDAKANSVSQTIRTIGEQIFKETVKTAEGIRSEAVNARIKELVDKAAGPFNATERGFIIEGVRDEVLGFGPLGPLLRDPTVEHIFVNGVAQIYVVRSGRQEKSNVGFEDEKHLYATVEKILHPLGLHLDENNPMISARMPNGSPVEICGPPLSVDGPTLSISCVVSKILSLGQMIEAGMITSELAERLKVHVKNRSNIVVSGFGDVSQNVLISALSAHIGPAERVISVESVAKLRLMQEHWIRFEKGSASSGKSSSIRALVAKTLRMRPDRIVLGDCNGEEAYELLEACSYGSTRSIIVVNASSTADCLRRLEKMISSGEPSLAREQVLELMATGVHVIVHMQRFDDGTCRVAEVAEVNGAEGDRLATSTLFD